MTAGWRVAPSLLIASLLAAPLLIAYRRSPSRIYRAFQQQFYASLLAIGFGSITAGAYFDAIVFDGCRLPPHFACLAVAVLGAPPRSETQSHLAQSARGTRMHWQGASD